MEKQHMQWVAVSGVTSLIVSSLVTSASLSLAGNVTMTPDSMPAIQGNMPVPSGMPTREGGMQMPFFHMQNMYPDMSQMKPAANTSGREGMSYPSLMKREDGMGTMNNHGDARMQRMNMNRMQERMQKPSMETGNEGDSHSVPTQNRMEMIKKMYQDMNPTTKGLMKGPMGNESSMGGEGSFMPRMMKDGMGGMQNRAVDEGTSTSADMVEKMAKRALAMIGKKLDRAEQSYAKYEAKLEVQEAKCDRIEEEMDGDEDEVDMEESGQMLAACERKMEMIEGKMMMLGDQIDALEQLKAQYEEKLGSAQDTSTESAQ